MLQGPIPSDIFIRQYWSPKLKELRDRIYTALKELDSTTIISIYDLIKIDHIDILKYLV